MAKYLKIRSEWAGGDTRQEPATLFSNVQGDTKFDTSYGIGYVVRPGGGTIGNDAERIESMSLTDTRFEIKWHATGGQNYTITLKFVDDENTSAASGSTGARDASSTTVDNETDI